MYKILLISRLLLLLLTVSMVLIADESESSKLSCLDQGLVDKSIIAALTATNQTLTLRVQALSQLLAVAQRQKTDDAAVAAVSSTENKILQKMGLSTTDCKIQIDGSVKCISEEK